MEKIYNMSAEKVRMTINGTKYPLSEEQVEKRIKEYGYNEILDEKRKSVLGIFIEQYKDFLVMILIVSAVISGLLGDIKSTIVILVVITMNAILGTIQTVKAEKSINSLKQMSGPEAKVLRNGNVIIVPSREITVGDEIILEAGDCIPADGRLIEVASLKTDESMLTGESINVDKSVEELEGELSIGDRLNMVYSGSFVTYGRGRFLVTAVGMDTEMGKIATLMKSTAKRKTPLQRNLDSFGKKLSIAILSFCTLIFILNIVRGENIENAFTFAVALAVAAIPEALSSIVTIVLSIGTNKMAKEHAIVRKLQAVEGLGSISIICSDKTGTLTQNKMVVENSFVNNADNCNQNDVMYQKLQLLNILCNDSSVKDGVLIGDPTEIALVDNAVKSGINVEQERDKHKRVGEIPFDSDRKLMTTINEFGDKLYVVTKGAVDELLSLTTKIEIEGQIREITYQDKSEINKANLKYSENGMRVLALSYKETNESIDKFNLNEVEDNLVFLGLTAMMDPPRDSSMGAVAECKKAGIRPIMITGDHRITASAIAKKLGIIQNLSESCNGAEIDTMTDEELMEFVPKVSVYARVSPEHKIRIVNAWQKRGNFVAMTGDGVNDAPALKQADIGIAMGITGSGVAKDASSMVLTDDNFSTIVKAVENGRNVYRNIKYAIQFLLSGNLGAILCVLFAAITMLPVPFAAVHLLVINLLTDSLPAIALGMENHDSNVMKERPRRVDESILTKTFLFRIIIEGFMIGITTMGAFVVGYQTSSKLASTMAFGTLCIGRLFHGFNCKSNEVILFKKSMFNNKYLFIAFAAGAIFMTSVLMIPLLDKLFIVQTLEINQLLIVYMFAFMNIPLVQFAKYIYSKIEMK